MGCNYSDDINDADYAQELHERSISYSQDMRCRHCSSHPDCIGVSNYATACPHKAVEFSFSDN